MHVLDASRCVGVVDRLTSPDHQAAFIQENRALQQQLVDSYEKRQVQLVPYREAWQRRFRTNWSASSIDKPTFLGSRQLQNFPLADIVPYIDWSPFFMAWELKGKYPRILEDAVVGAAARDLFASAQQLLQQIITQRQLTAHAVYGFWPAASDGDDIVLFTDDSRQQQAARFPMLRQQWQRRGQDDFRSLADYVAPLDSGRSDYVGAFALTAGIGLDELCAAHTTRRTTITTRSWPRRSRIGWRKPWQNVSMTRVRREWGYGQSESLSPDRLIAEEYRGIRPAPGYPACPDHTLKGPLFELLDATASAAVQLTETYAMWPAASICGFYFAHPQARYFAVDRITRDQVEDYARRKGTSIADVEKWLAPNLGYEPATAVA